MSRPEMTPRASVDGQSRSSGTFYRSPCDSDQVTHWVPGPAGGTLAPPFQEAFLSAEASRWLSRRVMAREGMGCRRPAWRPRRKNSSVVMHKTIIEVLLIILSLFIYF